MRFAWIDFEQDIRIAHALIQQVERWARERGMEAVHGPLGFTDLDYEGMLVSGFDKLGTMATIYNSLLSGIYRRRLATARRQTGWNLELKSHKLFPPG